MCPYWIKVLISYKKIILTPDFWRLVYVFWTLYYVIYSFTTKRNAVLLVYDLNWVQQKKTGLHEIIQSQ